MKRLLPAVLLALAATPAQAAPSCRLGADVAPPQAEGPSAREPRRRLPIGSYTLSLIWVPQQCPGGHDIDCTLYARSLAAGGRRDGFVLHGLWPDGEGRDWPQYCEAAAPLPARLIADHLCATPSPQLIQHEWAKHGTCMAGYGPSRYFALSNRLAAAIRMPGPATMAGETSAARLAAAIAARNRGMTAEMMRFYLDDRGWLREVWFCLDTGFRPQACPATQGGARGEDRIRIRAAG